MGLDHPDVQLSSRKGKSVKPYVDYRSFISEDARKEMWQISNRLADLENELLTDESSRPRRHELIRWINYLHGLLARLKQQMTASDMRDARFDEQLRRLEVIMNQKSSDDLRRDAELENLARDVRQLSIDCRDPQRVNTLAHQVEALDRNLSTLRRDVPPYHRRKIQALLDYCWPGGEWEMDRWIERQRRSREGMIYRLADAGCIELDFLTHHSFFDFAGSRAEEIKALIIQRDWERNRGISSTSVTTPSISSPGSSQSAAGVMTNSVLLSASTTLDTAGAIVAPRRGKSKGPVSTHGKEKRKR